MSQVTVFYGLYGSGKSEVSINYALRLAREGRAVTIVDLDAVTPYFRVRDVRERLLEEGVRVVAPKESIRHADLPVLPEGIRRILMHGEGDIVVDVGGDPTGARVLGGLKDALRPGARGLFVLNAMRPFSRTLDEAEEAVDRVTSSAGLPPGGLVSNTHLGELTRIEHISSGLKFAEALGLRLGLPVVMVGVPAHLKSQEEELAKALRGVRPLYLERYLLKPWEIAE
ncbi:MAG: hypothetical protein ACOX4B_08890 [Bacillota bacterium]|nr:hypothetical protein [Candidatus Fermentithermobacillaceae bacterium]